MFFQEELIIGGTACKNVLWTRALSEDPNQPAQSRSLIRIFTRRTLDSQECGQRRLRSDCADAQVV